MTIIPDATLEQGAPAVSDQQAEPTTAPEPEQQAELTPHQQKMARLRAELLGQPAEAEGQSEELEDEAGAPAEETQGGADAAPDDDGDTLVLEFPGRMEGDPAFALPITREWLEEQGLSAQDVIERHRQLVNGYGRRSALRAERAELEAERREFQAELEAVRRDPARFLAAELPAEQRASVVEALLLELDDAAYRQVATKVDRWARDAKARQQERERAELEALRGAKQNEQQGAKAAAIAENVQAVATAVTALIPEDMDDNRARLFFNAAIGELVRHGKANNLDILDPATVPELLAKVGVLEVYGLAGASPAGSSRTNGSSPAPAKAPGASPSGQDDARDRMARRKGAVAAPAGAASSAASGFQKVKGERHLDRRNRLAKALGLPVKSEL